MPAWIHPRIIRPSRPLTMERSLRGRFPVRKEGILATPLSRKDTRAQGLQRLLPPFPGSDADHLLEVVHEDFPVADLAGARGGQDPFEHRRHHLVRDGRLALYPR